MFGLKFMSCPAYRDIIDTRHTKISKQSLKWVSWTENLPILSSNLPTNSIHFSSKLSDNSPNVERDKTPANKGRDKWFSTLVAHCAWNVEGLFINRSALSSISVPWLTSALVCLSSKDGLIFSPANVESMWKKMFLPAVTDQMLIFWYLDYEILYYIQSKSKFTLWSSHNS